MKVDLRSAEDINAAVQFTLDTYGRVDLLHNVGFNPVHVTTKDFDILTTDMDDYEEMLAVTLRGYVLSCRAVIPHMVENGGGAIVNTSSLAAIRSLPTGLRFSYSIAKSGLTPLSQHIAVRFGKQGIRCNTAALGMVISESFMATMSPDRVQDRRRDARPQAGRTRRHRGGRGVPAIRRRPLYHRPDDQRGRWILGSAVTPPPTFIRTTRHGRSDG